MNTDVRVQEVMDREYLGVSESDDLIATVELFLRDGVETAIVLRGSEPVGVVTSQDVLRLLVEGPDPTDATVQDAMSDEVPTVAPDTSVAAAAEELSTRDARRVLVSGDDGEPHGILTERDVLAIRSFGTEIEHPTGRLTMEQTPGSNPGPDAERAAVDEFQEQGICEVCGTFTGDLAAFNGQLVCADCRNI